MQISLERLMDRVSIVIDCNSGVEADQVWNNLSSQILDHGQIAIKVSLSKIATEEEEKQP